MKRMRRDQIGDITNMTVFELIFPSLDTKRVAVYCDDSAESYVLITELFRWIEEVLSLL